MLDVFPIGDEVHKFSRCAIHFDYNYIIKSLMKNMNLSILCTLWNEANLIRGLPSPFGKEFFVIICDHDKVFQS